MSFGMYELWFLIDEYHFIIDDIETIITSFAKHDEFNKFVSYFFDDRVKAKKEGNDGLAAFDKNNLNSSYGADGQNNEKFSSFKFLDRKKVTKAHAAGNFKHNHKVTDNLFIIENESLSARCNKPLQSSYATLSNAKYWYLLFVYKFLFRCLDKSRMHFVYIDTDSYMWAIA
jgi:hypothetical protein